MMLWGEREKTSREVVLEAQVDALGRDLSDANQLLERSMQESHDLHAQCRLLREIIGQHHAQFTRQASLDGEFLALTREASGLRTTVTFLNGHIDAISRERQALLSHLMKANIETPMYEISMAPPTPGQEAVEALGRAATGESVGDVLNRLRDQRDGAGLKQAADDLGVFDDLGDPSLPE